MPELTDEQIQRLDDIHNKIHKLLCELAGTEVPWDMEAIGDMCDVAEEFICDKLKLMPPEEFAPFVLVDQ